MLNLKEICDNNIYPPIETFFSRRNKVQLKEIIGGGLLTVVVKEHGDEKNAAQEVKFLTDLYAQQVRVPLCYGRYKNMVCTEYLPGNLLNTLVDNSNEYGYEWIPQLAQWYYEFHRAFLNSGGQVLLKGDNNLRNFLYYKNVIYGFDFEEPVYGYPEQDIGECCAYILTNSPAFTAEKFFIIKELSSIYFKLNSGADSAKLNPEIIKSLREISERRPNQKEEILTNLSTFG